MTFEPLSFWLVTHLQGLIQQAYTGTGHSCTPMLLDIQVGPICGQCPLCQPQWTNHQTWFEKHIPTMQGNLKWSDEKELQWMVKLKEESWQCPPFETACLMLSSGCLFPVKSGSADRSSSGPPDPLSLPCLFFLFWNIFIHPKSLAMILTLLKSSWGVNAHGHLH